MSDDVLAEFETPIDDAERADADQRFADPTAKPWGRDSDGGIRYQPNVDLLSKLLSGPMSDGANTQNGRLAKAFDAWMAYELRRAGMHPHEVWPRNTTPRVSARDLAPLIDRVEKLTDWVSARDSRADADALRREETGDMVAVADAGARLAKEHVRLQKSYANRQAAHAKAVAKAAASGNDAPDPLPALVLPGRVSVTDPLLPSLRSTIQGVVNAMPSSNATNVLGRFYTSRSMWWWPRVNAARTYSSAVRRCSVVFAKNTKNRYEPATRRSPIH